MATREELLQELRGAELLDALDAAERPGTFAPGGPVDDVARSVLGGITLGFQEEISAGIETAMGRGPFSEALEREETKSAEIPASIRIPGNIVGGVATGAGLARMFPAAFSTLPRAAGAAAAEGAVAGFGFSPEDRLSGAVTGFLTGGILGAALPKTFEGLAAGWRAVSSKFGTPTRQAGALVLQQLRNGGISANQAKARLAKLGREAVLADIPELRGLAERVAQSGGIGARRAQRILNIRAKKAGDRIVSAAGDILGNRRQFQETLTEMVQERAALAGPLYEKAYAVPIRLNDNLQQTASKIGKLAPTVLKRAERSLAAEVGEAIQEVSISNVGRNGRVEFTATPGVQYWDLVKRELDDLIGNAVRAGQRNRARQLSGIRDAIVESVDAQTDGAYGAAREAFSGAIKLEEALQAGRSFIRGDADAIIDGITKATEGEKEMFRLGVVKAIQDVTEGRTLTSDQTRRIFDTARNNRILKAVFPDTRSLRRFKQIILREKEFTETNRILQGSQTFRRQAQAEEGNRAAIEAARDLLTQGRGGLIGRTLDILGRERSLSPEVSQQLGRTLFAPGAEAGAALGRLGGNVPAVPTGRALGAGTALGGATGVSGIAEEQRRRR